MQSKKNVKEEDLKEEDEKKCEQFSDISARITPPNILLDFIDYVGIKDVKYKKTGQNEVQNPSQSKQAIQMKPNDVGKDLGKPVI